MPNWCECSLQVIGEKKELRKFYKTGLILDKEKKETWSIEPYYPYPGEWDYDWCVDNWGTKWDVNNPQWGVEDECFTVIFLSAWAPPVEWLKKVQQDYKDLYFILTYLEPGMQFCGVAHTINDGHVFINDICEDICEFVNECEEPVFYDEEIERWIVIETGEVMEEDCYTDGINHVEKNFVAIERERKINGILAD